MPKTSYTIFRPGQEPETRSVDLPQEPGYDRLVALIRPLLDGGDLEHVAVLHGGGRADMFVDERGALKGLQVNSAATDIYHAAQLSREPAADRTGWPSIHGAAVLFDSRVWF